MLTTISTASIFPDTNTKKITDGYEASFLVFNSRPSVSGQWEKPEYVYRKGKLVADNTAV